tara:strand:+ start:1249 stop:1533 length:285 start_codon:yes stop_codon:yes gene_type:complete
MIDKDVVIKVAKLAKIEIDQSNLTSLSKELSDIIDFVDQLNEVKVDNIEPFQNISFQENAFREDIITEGNEIKKIMINAPSSIEDFFSVPKVIE